MGFLKAILYFLGDFLVATYCGIMSSACVTVLEALAFSMKTSTILQGSISVCIVAPSPDLSPFRSSREVGMTIGLTCLVNHQARLETELVSYSRYVFVLKI